MKNIVSLILLLFTINVCLGQTGGRKVVVKTYDAKGNLIKQSTTKQLPKKNTKHKGQVKMVKKADGSVVRQTTINLGPVIDRPFNADTIDKNRIVLQVYKKYDRLYIYHKGKFLTAYHCVFGKNKLGQKYSEGDKRTPEGWFSITEVRKHAKWAYFMGIDYPNVKSRENHAMAKARGVIPANARIGGSVGIHGVWKGGDMAVKNKFHWTDGCVSLSNDNVAKVAQIVQPGTRIYIGWEK